MKVGAFLLPAGILNNSVQFASVYCDGVPITPIRDYALTAWVNAFTPRSERVANHLVEVRVSEPPTPASRMPTNLTRL